MKLIPLTHGKYAQVDDEDFEHLNKWKWRAQIRIDGNKKHIGYFATEKEAAIAYNKMARTHHKQFANLNIVISAIIVLALSSCTSGRDLGYVYGNLEPAYYPKRFHIPGLIDIQKGSKREGLKIKEAENRKKFSLSLKF